MENRAPASATCPPTILVDLARIELASPQCECGVLPLDHRPDKQAYGGRVKMPRNTTLLWAPKSIFKMSELVGLLGIFLPRHYRSSSETRHTRFLRAPHARPSASISISQTKVYLLMEFICKQQALKPVGLPGIEPGLHAPEACVLPAYSSPKRSSLYPKSFYS